MNNLMCIFCVLDFDFCHIFRRWREIRSSRRFWLQFILEETRYFI